MRFPRGGNGREGMVADDHHFEGSQPLETKGGNVPAGTVSDLEQTETFAFTQVE